MSERPWVCRWLAISAAALALGAAAARAPSALAKRTAQAGADVTLDADLAASLGLPQQARKAKTLWQLPDENPDRSYEQVSVLMTAGGDIGDMIWQSQVTTSHDSTPRVTGIALRVSKTGSLLNAATISGTPGRLGEKSLPADSPAARKAFSRARRFWLQEANWSRLHSQ